MGSWAEDVLFGAVSQGVNHPTFVVLNVCLLLAVLSLASLLVASIASNPALVPHVAFLLFLAIGLWAAIVWFVSNIGFTDPQEQRKELFGEEQQQQQEQVEGEQEQQEGEAEGKKEQ
jgi:ABC-type transport system involved in multi-copper enzyme maturation permease subunit